MNFLFSLTILRNSLAIFDNHNSFALVQNLLRFLFCQKKMLLPEMRIEDFLEEQTVSTAEKAMLHQIITAGLQSTEPFELTTAKFLIKDHQNNLWFLDSKHRNITNSSEAPLLTTSAEQGKKMFIEGVKLGRPAFTAAAIKLLLDGSPNLSVKYALSELSLALVEQERGIDEVIQWAKLAIVYPERPMIEFGVDIFKALFAKGYAVDEAIDTLLIASNRRYLAGLKNTVKTSFSHIVKTLSDNNLINTPARLAKIKELKNQIDEMDGVDYEKHNSID